MGPRPAQTYAVRVRVAPDAAEKDREKSEAASSVASEILKRAPEPAGPDEDNKIRFSAGNPRVEHVTGVVHLYREVQPRAQVEKGPWKSIAKGPEGCDRLCVLELPPDLSTADLCSYVGAYLQHVREMRLVRRADRRRVTYSVILRFDSPGVAAEFHRDFDGKPFSALETDFLCRLVYVQDVEMSTDGDLPPDPPAGQTELPSCPVCLERLDQHISGVVTTVCNHMFHSECLKGWEGSTCPVCRYCASADASASHCAVCNTSQDVWICLICGHVGCGRYRSGHAAEHWKATGHCYALELESQRVWDYASDGYVHRLIQSKVDGKLVEVPSPGQECASTSRPGGREGGVEDKDMGDALLESKMDYMVSEYQHLLVTQLEAQREYFEGLLRGKDAELESARQSVEADKANAAADAALAASREADVMRRVAERKLATLEARHKGVQKEVEELRVQVDALLADHKRFRELDEAAKTSAAAKDARIKELEDEVHDFMVNLTASAQLAALSSDAVEGSISVPPPKPTKRRGGAKK